MVLVGDTFVDDVATLLGGRPWSKPASRNPVEDEDQVSSDEPLLIDEGFASRLALGAAASVMVAVKVVAETTRLFVPVTPVSTPGVLRLTPFTVAMLTPPQA